ncbi:MULTISPECIES: hypothetical protein [unclassified Streptomyces]|uniref:hypothetical protein n=1 Tax=unclassified Streptomyces TaxID=2593676 RepID=UPI003865A784
MVDGYAAVFTVSCCVAVLGVVVLVLFVREAPAPAVRTPLPGVRTLVRVPGLRRLCATAAVLGLPRSRPVHRSSSASSYSSACSTPPPTGC